jgi:Pyruvate/2-oxoacid:ferredoxin oxidoreductase gamma subunit
VDGDRVSWAAAPDGACHALPIAATARRVIGTPVGANLVGLGALVGLSGLVPPDAVERAVAIRRPGGSAEPDLRAFRAGLALVDGAAGGAPSDMGEKRYKGSNVP